MILAALHGFFGTPDDWSASIDRLTAESARDLKVLTPDLAVWATRAGVTDFETFSASFNRSVRSLAEETQQPVIIAGYSLGARLAAHCVLDEPDLYQSALLISMNAGLPQNDLEVRRERFESDLRWSDRLRHAPWSETWTAWNEQSVLKPGARGLLRRSSPNEPNRDGGETGRKFEGRREAWARAMEIWSLGHQRDLRADLVEWASEDHRLTLLTGTDDAKFTQLTTAWLASVPPEELPETIRHRLVLGAGHRILNESPEDVAFELASLIGRD